MATLTPTTPLEASPTTTLSTTQSSDNVPIHHASPVVAFIIGLSIILVASLLNAGGLNLTKLDHVRTSAIPKPSRRKDWLRPLWLLGMLLYILSQLIGSTLALEYMRAEYVAPLGSTSLIFNFLFASLLVGTPVTSTDIYGTIIVILGVVGIVLFGSMNSGLESEFDLQRLKGLWGRANWLLYFIVMSLALTMVYTFASQLEFILNARADLSATPFAGMRGNGSILPVRNAGLMAKIRRAYSGTMSWIRDRLETWTAAKDDKTLAWTLGIGWACCGGGLAGGCLVFAKACVKLISGTLSQQNTGNQFAHPATIFTFLFLAVTAVFQIICLNRGLKVYDSTLVVPVFYGVYTASGFLNSLIFNNEVDAYKTWTLSLIMFSIFILISGVVLLTHKKPEARTAKPTALDTIPARTKRIRAGPSRTKAATDDDDDDDEEDRLRVRDDDEGEGAIWELGDASDDEDGSSPSKTHHDGGSRVGLAAVGRGVEAEGLMRRSGEDPVQDEHRRSSSSDTTVVRTDENPFKDDEEFGGWNGAVSKTDVR